MAATRGFADERGITRLSLLTGAGNEWARAFYRAAGFAEEDVRLTLSW